MLYGSHAKKLVFAASVSITCVSFLVTFFRISKLCFQEESCTTVVSAMVGYSFFTFFPLALITLITLFLKDAVFRYWAPLGIAWVFFSLIIFFYPSQSLGDYGVTFYSPHALVVLISPFIFTIISLLLISYKSFQLYRKK